jgi:hypothetical protein
MKKVVQKAQLGSIVKTITGATKGIKAGYKSLKQSKAAKSLSKAKGYGESGQYRSLSDMRKSENYRSGKGYKDPIGDKESADKLKLKVYGTAGAGVAGASLAQYDSKKAERMNKAKVAANKAKVEANKKKVKANKLKTTGSYKFAKGGNIKKK